MLELDPGLRPDAYLSVFKQFGRLHLPGFMTQESATALETAITGAPSAAWRRAIHVDVGKDYDLSVEELDGLPPTEREALEAALREGSPDELQYVFDTIRVSSELKAGTPVHAPLAEAADFLNSDAFLDFARRLTGDERLVFCDVMATRYQPGHYLTVHGDEHPEQNRLYAYVLNLTRRWRVDWGGVLIFLDEDDHVAEGYVPAWNALNIFRVPQRHAVTLVTHLAQAPRLSLTGWIHGRR